MVIGTPPTPIPTFMWIGIVASSTQGFTMVQARATFQAAVLPVFTLTAGPNMWAPALVATLKLLARPEAGETHAVVLELAVHAEHELAGHADLDAELGVAGAQRLGRPERGEEVGVAGGAGGVEVDAVGAGLREVHADVRPCR